MLAKVRSFLAQRPIWAAAIAAIAAIALCSLYIRSEVKRLESEELIKGLSLVGTLRAKLEGTINANLSLIRAIKAEVLLNPQVDQKRLEVFVKALMTPELQIRHIALAPNLIIKYIYPVEGNERAIGLDYTASNQVSSVVEAVQKNELVVAGPLELVQGGKALVVRVPIYIPSHNSLLDKKLWGIVSAVIDYPALIDKTGIKEDYYGLQVGIRGVDGKGANGSVFFGYESVFTDDAALTTVSLPNGSWILGVRPFNGWQAPRSRLYLMYGGAISLSMFIGFLGFLLATAYREKSIAVATANYRASFDVLTGLANRYYFSQRLGDLIRDMRREKQDFAIFFIDIDHFKQVNDSIGHNAGDKLLVEFAQRLQQSARDTDIVARLAGDEFVIVFRNVSDVIQADLLAEKLQNRIQLPFLLDGRSYLITASIGIAMYPVDGEDVTSLLLHSDQAMYTAKRAGRNAYYFFNEGMREEADHYLLVHADILRGLGNDEFELYYQPILNIENQQIQKCEALIRWNHPEKGLVGPDNFIPVAERTGAIRELGNWVLKQACKDMRKLQDADVFITMSVNRSVGEFYSTKAYEVWKNIFADNGVSPSRFIFEITESIFMDRHHARMKTINALRKLGISFAIDDFGTGYSAINYLRSYPVDFLKIDKSFINDLNTDAQDRTLVEVIIKMGGALGIKVIAEGVEELSQLEALQTLGCDYIQGYWLSRPVPISQFIALCHLHSANKSASE